MSNRNHSCFTLGPEFSKQNAQLSFVLLGLVVVVVEFSKMVYTRAKLLGPLDVSAVKGQCTALSCCHVGG